MMVDGMTVSSPDFKQRLFTSPRPWDIVQSQVFWAWVRVKSQAVKVCGDLSASQVQVTDSRVPTSAHKPLIAVDDTAQHLLNTEMQKFTLTQVTQREDHIPQRPHTRTWAQKPLKVFPVYCILFIQEGCSRVEFFLSGKAVKILKKKKRKREYALWYATGNDLFDWEK